MNHSYYDGAVALKDDLLKFMQDIIRIPSLSSSEGVVIQRIREEMERLGFDEVTVDPMGNLLGRIGSGPRVIALDGHVDTVDVGNPALWERDPHSGDIEDGILYGRGASDMKGGVASSVYAGALLKQTGLPDDVTLYVTATVQEEDCDGLCWQYIVNEDGLRPELVVITEPTSLNIYRGQRGRMEMEVHTFGLSCHGSAPERGDNAIYKMAGIIADIEKLNQRLAATRTIGQRLGYDQRDPLHIAQPLRGGRRLHDPPGSPPDHRRDRTDLGGGNPRPAIGQGSGRQRDGTGLRCAQLYRPELPDPQVLPHLGDARKRSGDSCCKSGTPGSLWHRS